MDASLYDELARVEQSHWWFRARRHIVWSLVRRFVEGGADRRLQVCELGCGTGGNLVPIADEHEVTGIECSPNALKHASIALGARIHFGRLPHEIDLPPNTFDVILMTDVLEHIEHDAESARRRAANNSASRESRHQAGNQACDKASIEVTPSRCRIKSE